ncbi:SbcC/MukB-like Walker B domain-containing protein [Aeromicrobium alkaliterrae]
MTHGRYQLLHSDDAGSRGTSGLELTVLDAHTGDSRSPSSLSGGEKFQASLALALGLAEVVTSRAGGLRLDTLFIDEGFGSLDAETLETTMETLDSLREGGRTIGLISHVEAMRESIPAQVQIDVTDGGWSTIRSTG